VHDEVVAGCTTSKFARRATTTLPDDDKQVCAALDDQFGFARCTTTRFARCKTNRFERCTTTRVCCEGDAEPGRGR
jgi:hypothetical protein